MEPLAPSEVEARIERQHAWVLPPVGTEQAEVDRVFGKPHVVTELQSKGSRANLPHAHLRTPAPASAAGFRAVLVVDYREGRVRRRYVNHSHVAKGRPLSRKGTPLHEQPAA